MKKNKKYFFLVGLPRSGITLLSSILNQNKKIIVSPLSLCAHMIDSMEKELRYHDTSILFPPDEKSINSVLSNFLNNYYEHLECDYIIDRNQAWGTPYYLNLIRKYITDDIKILFPIRPLVEVLTSFCSLCDGDENNFIDQSIKEDELYVYKEINETRCEWLMRSRGQIDTSLFSLKNLLKDENKSYLHLIRYHSLVKNPQKTLNSIYDFLNIERYDHDFQNISEFSFSSKKYRDSHELFRTPKLHYVRAKLEKKSKDPHIVLGKRLVNLYSHYDFW